MKKFESGKLVLIVLMILTKNAFSQIDYGITAMVARNNFVYDSWMYYEYWDGEPKAVYIWAKEPQANIGMGVGGYIRIGFKNLPIGFEINPEIQFLRAKLYHKIQKSFEYSQLERVYIPIKLNAKLMNNLTLFWGINYSYAFNFKKLKIPEAINYSSNWGFLGGVDYQIISRLSIGAYYYNSFNFDFETPAYNLGFTANGVALKLRYSLSSVK